MFTDQGIDPHNDKYQGQVKRDERMGSYLRLWDSATQRAWYAQGIMVQTFIDIMSKFTKLGEIC